MKLFHKIFLVYLLVSFVLIVSVFSAVKFTAVRHFKAMENRAEKEMFTTLVRRLAADYRQNGNWKRFAEDPRAFGRLAELSIDIQSPFPGPAPPQISPPPPSARATPKDSPFKKPVRPHDRVTLFDQGRNPIAGAIPPDDMCSLKLKPIQVDKAVVGYIGFRKLDRLPERFGPPFKEKLETLYIIGTILFLLAGIVAFMLSRHILSPVERLARGTRSLARFQFHTRIKVDTRDELGRLASDFNRMAVTLERYEAMRRQWMTDISHELRTPLSVLKGEIEAIQDGIRQPDGPSMNSLHSEVVYLENMVDDLHRLSLADAGTLGMQMAPVMPVRILGAVMETFSTRLASVQVTADVRLVHQKVVMLGDGTKLKQLFSNIIENNIQYTRRPGSVRVRDSLKEKKLEITFEDSGPGVPHESLEKIFDRLYRVDPARSGSRKNGKGSGLGLAICRAVARGHGGEIHADINREGGLTLTVRLPVC